MNTEANKCAFCGETKEVSRFYLRLKNKHFDDNKQGQYSTFIYYCNDCGIDTEAMSDGYHTFAELYEHRIRLFIELCRLEQMYLRQVLETSEEVKADVWCSVQHADGSTFGDWFILGIGKEKGKQISYHLPARFWNEVTEFAEVLGKAPEWDGHTSDDVLERLRSAHN